MILQFSFGNWWFVTWHMNSEWPCVLRKFWFNLKKSKKHIPRSSGESAKDATAHDALMLMWTLSTRLALVSAPWPVGWDCCIGSCAPKDHQVGWQKLICVQIVPIFLCFRGVSIGSKSRLIHVIYLVFFENIGGLKLFRKIFVFLFFLILEISINIGLL